MAQLCTAKCHRNSSVCRAVADLLSQAGFCHVKARAAVDEVFVVPRLRARLWALVDDLQPQKCRTATSASGPTASGCLEDRPTTCYLMQLSILLIMLINGSIFMPANALQGVASTACAGFNRFGGSTFLSLNLMSPAGTTTPVSLYFPSRLASCTVCACATAHNRRWNIQHGQLTGR
jgi:hypothetical protein